jgi:hypothetical protein
MGKPIFMCVKELKYNLTKTIMKKILQLVPKQLFFTGIFILFATNVFAYTPPTALQVVWSGADQTSTCHNLGDYITNVTFAGINNTTAGSGAKAWHTDFGRTTTQVAPGQVTIGQTYNISITITGSDLNYDYLAVYVDWNQNNVNGTTAFPNILDANENPVVWYGMTGTGSKTLTGTINVPAGISSGQIYMRVMLDADGGGINGGDYQCAIGYGEFQDYVLNVSAPVALPTVTGISPTSGVTAGGSSVIITGTNLTATSAVKFGSTNATGYTVNSATQITATSPAGSLGTVDVTVTTTGGTSVTGSSDQFTYFTVPTATTNAASSITTTGITLNGSINANNASTAVTFDYGTTTSYGTNVVAIQSPVTGNTATAVSKALTGLTPNTTYHFRVNGVNTAGTTNGTDLTFTTLAAASSTFQNEGNWSTASNWSAGIPGTTTEVILADGCNVNGNFPAKNVTVNPGVDLTIASGNTLTVSGNFTLKSDAADGTATLIDNGTLAVSGTTSVEQYLTSGRNWYVSSPTSGATTAAISNSAYLASYSEPTASWVTESATLTPLKGYVAVSETANAPITFTGTLNTGNKTNAALTATTANASYKGYNLVGNPYPSYVDWTQATKTNLLTTMWYRTTEGVTYKFYTYNSTGSIGVPSSVTGIIPPMQAFWVNVATGSTGTLGFTNAMRSHVSGSNPLRAPAVEKTTQQLLRLQVSDGTNSDETVIYFNPNASDGYDSYDSPKMGNDNLAIPEIYTLCGTEKMVINGLNNSIQDKELQLGFKTGLANSFSIKATELSNFDTNTKIILKDNLLNTEKVLALGSEYDFTSDITNSGSRFSIIFKSVSGVTGTNNTADDTGINIFKNANGLITIQRNGNIGQEGRITVCNTLGQMLISTKTTGTNTIILKSFTPGVYVVSINIAGTVTTKKIVIN